MTAMQPGDSISYVVTYLEMTERPRAPVPPRPANVNTVLMRATDPPADYFLYLYKAVGEEYEWTDWFLKPKQDVEAFVGNSSVILY
ncbi:MAG: hypothetical protein AAF439_14740, partial [Pseudomonadota bacterium]